VCVCVCVCRYVCA
jgi:hypothetical protein